MIQGFGFVQKIGLFAAVIGGLVDFQIAVQLSVLAALYKLIKVIQGFLPCNELGNHLTEIGIQVCTDQGKLVYLLRGELCRGGLAYLVIRGIVVIDGIVQCKLVFTGFHHGKFGTVDRNTGPAGT